MVSYCCVKGCNSNSNNKKKDPSSIISFHAFPCNQELKTKWLRAIGRPNWIPPSHARICSLHFNSDQINYEGCRIRIKDDAIPVNSLPPNSNFEASDVEACRICLATDIRIYSLQDSHLKNCMDSLTGFNENYNIEGLPQYVCFECTAGLLKCYKLVEKSMIAQATLLDIFANNGQITKTLIQHQNRNKLNLKSSLNFFQTQNYYHYKYDAEKPSIETKQGTLQLIDNHEIDVKNETEVFDKEFKVDNDDTEEINDHDTAHDVNDDRSDDYTDLEACPINSPVIDSYTKNDINDIDEKKISYKSIRKKRLKSREKIQKNKSNRKKINGLTPDETDMQKYFDIVQLSLQEQIDEWKRSISRRSLTSETVYECEVCSKVFAHINTYRIHVTGHTANRGKFECTVCKLRFKSDVLAKSHRNRAHGKKFYCKTCPKVFNNVGVAKKHQRWHEGYKYKCRSCEFSTIHESALGVHMRRAHSDVHACTVCGRACISRRGLLLHTATAHRGAKATVFTTAYRCEPCNLNFATEGAKRVHLLTSTQHRKKPGLCDPITEDLKTTCSKCGVECSSFKDLVTHTRAEHPRSNKRQLRGQDSYPTDCLLCGETLSCRSKHWQHFRRQHPKEIDTYRPLVTAICDTCGKGFQNSTKLHLHQLRHGVPSVRCDKCPRIFYDKYALSRHAITHKTTKPHHCQTCGRAFKLRSNLERHARVHTDNTPYECTMCGKKFKYSSSVNLHVRTVHYKLPHPPRKKRNKSARDSIVNDIQCS